MFFICKVFFSAELQIFNGKSYLESGHIKLAGINAAGLGTFVIGATSGTEETTKRLVGYPNGNLIWDNNNLGDAAITSKLLNSNNGYIFFKCGFALT